MRGKVHASVMVAVATETGHSVGHRAGDGRGHALLGQFGVAVAEKNGALSVERSRVIFALEEIDKQAAFGGNG
eukprot:8513336-Lingulodinium_polyedra.AAC.1